MDTKKSKIQLNTGTISGPINIIRVEGMGKVVYLMGDYHYNIHLQTKCTNLSSPNIVQVMDQFIKASTQYNRKWDLMIETYAGYAEAIPTLVERERRLNHKTHKYLGELNKLFAKYFNIEPDTNESVQDYAKFKIISSNKYNVRFHNTNIRDKYCTALFFDEFRKIWNFMDVPSFAYFIKNLPTINESLYKIADKLISDHEIIFGPTNLPKNVSWSTVLKTFKRTINADTHPSTTNPSTTKPSTTKPSNPPCKISYMKYIVNKIKSKYYSKSTQKIMETLIDTLRGLFVDLIDKITQLVIHIKYIYTQLKQTYYTDNFEFKKKVSYGPKDNPKMQYGIDIDTFHNMHFSVRIKCYKISTLYVQLYTLFTDIYTVRRIVDKPYCTNAVVYVGDQHACNILLLLTKYFDFTITHASYSAQSIKTLNAEIKEQSITDKSWYTKNLNPPTFKQCSSMKGFPDLFL